MDSCIEESIYDAEENGCEVEIRRYFTKDDEQVIHIIVLHDEEKAEFFYDEYGNCTETCLDCGFLPEKSSKFLLDALDALSFGRNSPAREFFDTYIAAIEYAKLIHDSDDTR